MGENITTDLELTSLLLTHASEHGLDVEVVISALKAMKDDPNLTIQEAMHIGFFEWIK
jgi:hypothetical protein